MSQRWPTTPTGACPVLEIDASSGDESHTLTRMASRRELVVRRVDSSAHTVTLNVDAPLTLDGTVGGSMTVAPDSEMRVVAIDGGFESYRPGGLTSEVGAAITAAITADQARQNGTFARPSGAWSSATAYVGQEVVTYGGGTYRALAASTNVTPGTDETKWESWGGVVSPTANLITPVVSSYFIAGMPYSSATSVIADGAALASPFAVDVSTNFDRIACRVSSAGGAGSLVRLGIYTDNGSGQPGALILDAGTIDSSSTGVKEINISQTLARGMYWLVGVGQGTPTPSPTMYVNSAGSPRFIGDAVATNAFAGGRNGWYKSAVTGALPDPFGSPRGSSNNCLAVGLRSAP